MKKSFMMKSVYKTKSGFTLVEMVVTVGILGMVLAMTAGMVNYSVGKLRSARAKVLNDTIRSTFDVMAQKMYNANDKINVGSGDIYGFAIYDADTKFFSSITKPIIIIVSSGDTSGKTCTYFGKNVDKLSMAQTNCSGTILLGTSDLTGSLTSDKIEITNFQIENKFFIQPTASPTRPSEIPYFELNVKAREIQDTNNKTQLKTTFTMDYENLNNLIPKP